MKKFKSRRFWLTVLIHLGSGYLAANGQPEAAAVLSGINQGTYNIGQSLEDAAKAKAREAVRTAIEGVAGD